jgi:hypothetical protein
LSRPSVVKEFVTEQIKVVCSTDVFVLIVNR